MLDAGLVVEQGSPEELLDSDRHDVHRVPVPIPVGNIGFDHAPILAGGQSPTWRAFVLRRASDWRVACRTSASVYRCHPP